MKRENSNLFIEGAEMFGIHLEDRALEAFDLYLRELLKWNQKINLTAIRTERGIVLKHFLDSLSVNPYLSNASVLLDIGSGAGFPGIPLKIVLPSLQMTLIDAVRKKVDFQRHIIRTLGLGGIEAIHGRVQDKAVIEHLRERFDCVISRACSNLKTLLTLSHPCLQKGGVVLAMKGETADEEIPLLSGLKETRYALQKTVHFVLPFSSFKRTIILFQKQ
jgi:16S rRNA (guanine527-N7)-methyltransferase